MLRLIVLAYGVEDDRVVGGPNWLDTDRFDIIAKSAPSASQDMLKTKLQALLADRFKLAIHNEDRPLPVFVLTAGKTIKMKESAGTGEPDCSPSPIREPGFINLTCHNMAMAALAETLRQGAGGYFNHPVVDQTGLKGQYDFNLKWTPRGQLGAPAPSGDTEAPSGISAFEALDKQLGLKAEAKSQPTPVIVVEHVNQQPTDNPPGVTEKLPPPVTEFEVAEIRPSRPGAAQNANMRNGRLEAIAFSMKELITLAYDVDDTMVTGGEKWLDSDHFDIVAKAAPSASFEELRAMLRTLLEQRFKLVVHKEDQPVPVYALTLPNKKSPKLKETDGSARAGCKLGVDNGLRTYTCQNTTIAQFAEKIRQVAGGYLNHPVVDLTGLKGAYDFAVSWTPVGRTLGAVGRAGDTSQPSGAVPAAVEPNTGLTIFEAVDKQLGLKLAAQKHPLPVVVIDHMDRTPTEN